MKRIKAILRRPSFYLFLLFIATAIYVPVSELRVTRKLTETPVSTPNFERAVDLSSESFIELREGFGLPYSQYPQLKMICRGEIFTSHQLGPESEEEIFFHYNSMLAGIAEWNNERAKSLERSIRQRDNLFVRLKHAVPRLFGHLGLSEQGQERLETYQQGRGDFYAVMSDMYETFVLGDCLEPAHTLTFTEQTGTESNVQNSKQITLTNDNPLHMPEEYETYVTTPVYYEFYALPDWLSATPERGVLLTGEQETVNFTATCPVGAEPKTYEAKAAIFQIHLNSEKAEPEFEYS